MSWQIWHVEEPVVALPPIMSIAQHIEDIDSGSYQTKDRKNGWKSRKGLNSRCHKIVWQFRVNSTSLLKYKVLSVVASVKPKQ
mmetsp:Transcript_16480/g.27231  ORF Transcript_16480/g.27231 Transcript_16480/m.27231 type:complete len:83 (+) Transcript_16480:980-1228(+)